MATDKQNILQDLQTRLAELMRTSPAGDLERNLKAVLGQAFQRLELVTREEFDDYAALLASLRARVLRLEQTIADLEREPSPAPGAADAANRTGVDDNTNTTGEGP